MIIAPSVSTVLFFPLSTLEGAYHRRVPLSGKRTGYSPGFGVYLCVKDGEERGFTAAEFKQAQTDGWEKQYQYKVGKKKVYMAPSAAQAQGYERVSKYPKSTKYGRQNPITERWNSDE